MEKDNDKPTLTEKDSDALIQNIQQANRLLRTRAIILAIIFIIGFGFLSLNNLYVDEFQKYDSPTSIERELIELKNAPDLKAHMDSLPGLFSDWSNYYGYDMHTLKYEIKKGEYKDREPIIRALDEMREFHYNTRRAQHAPSISLLGLNIPFTPWFWIAPIVILILFHDFSQIMFYRNRLQNMFRFAGIPDWKQGAELFGTWGNNTTSVSYWFIRAIGSVVTMAFLLLPLFSAILFLFFAYNKLLHTKGNYLILGINALCPLLILIDIVILVMDANILRITSLVIWSAGDWNNPKISFKRILRWMLFPLAVFLLHFMYAAYYHLYLIDGYNITRWTYWVMLIVSALILPIGFWLRIKKGRRWLGNVFLFSGGMMVVYWLFAFAAMAIVNLYFGHIQIFHLADIAMVIVPVSFVCGAFYSFIKQMHIDRVKRK